MTQGRYAVIATLDGREVYADDESFARELARANHTAGVSAYVVDTTTDTVVYEMMSCVVCGKDGWTPSFKHELHAGWVCICH